MKNNDNICIRLYTKDDLKGKFYLTYGDAVQIEFWWKNQKLGNYATYERLTNNI